MTADRRDSPELDGYVHGRRGHVIQVKPGEKIPEGAVVINRFMVSEMKKDIIFKSPISETWAFRYGPYAVFTASWLSGAVVSYTMRRKLKLFQPTGRVLCYVAVVMGPALISGICHEIISQKVLDEASNCSVCLPMKSATLNIMCGWAVPSVSAVVAAAHIARQNNSYPVPRLNETRALVQLLNKLSYRYRPLYGAMFCVSFILPFIFTYQQAIEVKNVSLEKHIDLEEKITTKSDSWGDQRVRR